MPKRKSRPCENTDTSYGCKGKGKIKPGAHWSVLYCNTCRSPKEREANSRKVREYRQRLREEKAKKKAKRAKKKAAA